MKELKFIIPINAASVLENPLGNVFHHKGKSRAGSTPYPNNRKKKRKKK